MNTLEDLYYIPTLTDSWLSQPFTSDNYNTLTTPLESTFYDLFNDDPFSPLSDMVRPESMSTSSTLTSPSGSASDLDTAIQKRISVVLVTSPSASASELDTPIQKRINVACNKKITKRKSRAVKNKTTTFINATATNFRQLVQQMTGVKSGVAFLSDHCQEFVKRAPTSAVRRQDHFPAVMTPEDCADRFNNDSFPTLESWGVL